MAFRFKEVIRPFGVLRNRRFAGLYLAQTISLLGDAITWVGIALLAWEFGGEASAQILSVALTLRVTTFILFGSWAGVFADRFDRKRIMMLTHFSRMLIVACFPFVTAVWQLYVLIFILNIFNTFFTPAYKSSIPFVVGKKEEFANAIAISNSTWQVLGVVGPGLAGGLAVLLGARQIFFVDAVTFIIAAILIFFIPGNIKVGRESQPWKGLARALSREMLEGTRILFRKKPIRFALFVELATAIASGFILVNTIGHIKGTLGLGDSHYGWLMAAFGTGASIAAFSTHLIDRSANKRRILLAGALIISLSILFADVVPYSLMLVLWIFAGLGLSFTDMPAQILIASNTESCEQGKVYGAHFAWSHLWWGIAYPIAGFTGSVFQNYDYLFGGILSLLVLGIVWFFGRLKNTG